jgi:hypothetical protein
MVTRQHRVCVCVCVAYLVFNEICLAMSFILLLKCVVFTDSNLNRL